MSTIVALSTPRGRGALGVVRLSGPEALRIANQLTGSIAEFEPKRVTLAKLLERDGAVIDEMLVTYFKAPHSLTGEDVIEFSCHGSPAVLRKLIDLTLSLGAQLAGPGEFTLRALANGKVNLAQAEAIRDLISAQTEAAAKQAALQLNGELSRALEPLKQQLVDVIVVLESALEFVEDDLPAPQLERLDQELGLVQAKTEELAASYRMGHLLQDGLKVAIAGSPNVGKSSLFNKLVERDRAIVTELPGTTRDTLSETIDVDGIPIVLTDTAGVRPTADGIEQLGIERTQSAITEADMVLVVLDGSCALRDEDRDILQRTASTRRMIVLNKADLPSFGTGNGQLPAGLKVSAMTGEGLDSVRAAILTSFDTATPESGSLLVTNARHHDLLLRVGAELVEGRAELKSGRSEEVVLVPLHNALRLLGEITGETTTEDILSEIFATFCIGK
ncbi:MAG TPA: tRNA uridine-5-carboxymethylaminomethyl(34) synthesis GTPase MnmE [Pyrinomonadaceae bacterium]|nr:tRNA uridine-5-carboxymethylaminomethyl(34) synthesis GTPase MnmE [Pyrinomonadaceae bacterium]